MHKHLDGQNAIELHTEEVVDDVVAVSVVDDADLEGFIVPLGANRDAIGSWNFPQFSIVNVFVIFVPEGKNEEFLLCQILDKDPVAA